MLDPNVAQSLALAVAAANQAPAAANQAPAADAGAVGPAGGHAETDADLPFAAVLRRQLAPANDANVANIAKGVRELLHIPAESASDDKTAEAAADPDTMLAWLAQLFAGATPKAADATQYEGEGEQSTVPAATDEATMPVMIAAPSLSATVAAPSLPDTVAAPSLPDTAAAPSLPATAAAPSLPDTAAAPNLAATIAAPSLPATIPVADGQVASADEPALGPGPAHIESTANPANMLAGAAIKVPDGATDKNAGTETPLQLSTPAPATDAPKPTAILAAADQIKAESSAPTGNGSNAPQAGASFDALLNAAHAAPAASAAHARQPVTTANPAAVASIDTPVGAPNWSAEVGDKLAWIVGRQETRAELVLNPPQMGRIEISLSLNGNQANALFVSANPAVREALENAVPQLRETLQDAGITLGQAQVGAESFRQQSAHDRENSDNSRQAAERGADTTAGTTAGTSVATGPALRRGNGLIDTFA